MNVLESVGVVTRKAKNCYIWKGSSEVAAKIEDLRRKASVDCFGGPEDFRSSKKKPRGKKEVKILPRTPVSSQELGDSQSDLSQPPSQTLLILGSANSIDADVKSVIPKLESASGSRKEKSLGVLSQRFVQLFLMADDAVVSLEQAAMQLMGPSPSDSDPPTIGGDATKVLKTKVRRLYDIANILSSLNIIKKVHTRKRKPAFKWIGIQAATFSPTRLSVKRIADSSSPPGSANKRRKCFSSPSPGYFDESVNSSQSPGSLTVERSGGCVSRPLGERRTSLCVLRNPFDSDTLAKLKQSLNTMPQAFADRWQDWITKAKALVEDGTMTPEAAEKGIAQLLGPRKTNGEYDTRPGATSPKAASPAKASASPAQTSTLSEQAARIQQKTKPVEAEVAKTLELDGSPTTDVEDGTDAGSLVAAVNKDEGTPTVDSSAATMHGSFEWMTQDYIDSYMKQAKEAGPVYAEKPKCGFDS